MHRYTLSLTFSLLAVTAWAGTFELSDPAKELRQEQKALEEEAAAELAEPAAEPATEAGMRCTLDIDDGLCFCNEKITVHRLEMSQEQCMATLRDALDRHHPAPGG